MPLNCASTKIFKKSDDPLLARSRLKAAAIDNWSASFCFIMIWSPGRGAGVARTFGVGEAGGSNPLVPTSFHNCSDVQQRVVTL